MADNVTLNAMTGGATVAADEVTDGTLGTVKVQYVKLMDGTLDGTTKGVIDATYGLKVDVARTVSVVLAAGANVVGAVTQSGAWSVAQSGSWNVGQTGSWTVTANAGTGTMAVVERGATIASTSASVTTTSGQIVASSATRRTIVLTNLGTDYVWIGASGVTDNQGIRLAPGQALTIDRSPTAAVHAKAATGTQTVAIFTESD